MIRIKIFNKETDKNDFIEWLSKNQERNQADPDTLQLPNLQVIKAENSKGTIAYLPFHQALILESLAPNPEATSSERAAAYRELGKQAIFMSQLAGVGEAYFVASEPSIARLAEMYGFEKIEKPVYKLKL